MYDNDPKEVMPKPEVSIIPQALWKEQVIGTRADELKVAIRRCNMENKQVPDSWFIELGNILRIVHKY